MAQLVSRGFAALALTSVLFIAGPEHARACSGLECSPGTFFPVSGTVPANLKGIYWWPSNDLGEDAGVEEGVRLARVDGAAPELIDFTLETIARDLAGRQGYLIVPETPFVAGASYVAWDFGCDGPEGDAPPPPPEPGSDPVLAPAAYLYPFLESVEWSVARFAVTEAAALPTALGELVVAEQHDARVYVYANASCTEQIDVVARDAMLTLSASASPWADALFYLTAINGDRYDPQGGAQVDPYPGTAMAGRARELVYTDCSSEDPRGDSIAPGTHRIELHARIPGEDLALVSESRVTLICPEPDGGTDDDAAIGELDGGSTEAPQHDAGDDAGNGSSDGCSCRTTAPRSSSSALAIAAALLVLWRRRQL